MARVTSGRRDFLRATGSAVVAGLIAGCLGDITDENSKIDYGEYIDENEEPDYGDWFDNVDNYEGTIDARDEDQIEVIVGADGGHSFGPPAVLIDPGTEVVWEWSGTGGRHDVVHVDDAFESERTREEGHTFERVFEDSGVHRYVCIPHENGGMKGAIAVADAGEGSENE